jgi:tetratricopeptide (TPR) repeat protein
MRLVLLALMFAVCAPSSALLAQARKDASPCALFIGSVDRDAVVATCTQLIESGKLSGEALARAYLARLYARTGNGTGTIDHSRIIADATAVIEIAPQERLAYAFRLDSYLQTGDLDRALEDADKYVALAPEDWNALNVRSTVYAAKGDYARALADDTKAVEMTPKRATAYANRASTYLKAGRPADALSDLNTALSLSHSVPAHHYHLRGRALEEMGRLDEAIADYRRALRLAPNHAGYREALKRLGAAP